MDEYQLTPEYLTAARTTGYPTGEYHRVRIHFNRYHGGNFNVRWHLILGSRSIFVNHWRIEPGVAVYDESYDRGGVSAFVCCEGRVFVEGNTAYIRT